MSGDKFAQSQFVSEQIVASRFISQVALNRMLTESGKDLVEMTDLDFKRHAPLVGGIKDPFAVSVAEIFLSYEQRRAANEKAQWIEKEKGRGNSLSDEEFADRFGNAPWLLLEETLKLVGLSYKFSIPPEDSNDRSYQVTLVDDDGISIQLNDLSSGERVLLAVALSLFTGSRMSEAIELPRLLLLDEADASLHPLMIKSLLTVIEEIFVKQYNVQVILTTHSPTTVALAPPDSLFVMNRSGRKLQSVTTDEVLNLLTVGVSSLSVRLENRRQIFVESEVDQALYQDLFRILKGELISDHSAEFIAVGKNSKGGGCDAVVRIVADLRTAGNSTVLRIVDRDFREGASRYIHFLPDRYSIENLLLDPLIFGAFLLREGILSTTDLGLPGQIRHFELNERHAVLIISAMSKLFQFGDNLVEIEYMGGFTANVPREFLNMQGHTLQERATEVFAGVKRDQNRDLMQAIVNNSVADLPGFVPKSFIVLLENVLVG